MSTPEGKIQLAVIKYLFNKGIFCWRNNSMGVWDEKIRAYRSNPYAIKGVPDIIAITPPTRKQCGGIFVGLEIKTAKGKLSVDQVRFRDRCNQHNAEYHVIKSLNDIKALDHLWG